MKLIRVLFLTMILVLSLNAKEKVNVTFDELAIKDFIKLVSKITNKNILMNHKVNGTVNFVTNAPIYNTELIGILISVLESKGYTLVQKDSIIEVVRSVDAAKHNVEVVKRNEEADGSYMVTQTMKIHGENVDIVAAKIRYLISKTAKLMTMKESNSLVITDYPKNIATMKKVIKELESNAKTVVQVFEIEHADSKKLQKNIATISKSLFNEKIAKEKVDVILDDDVNTLILVGNQKNINILAKLINKLDVESNIDKTVKIYNLKNSDAVKVLKSLTDIVSKQVFKDPLLKPNISASEEINAIIAIGEPIIIKGIKLIIDELDREKYQVYVQAKIIEINKKNSEDVGIKWGFDAAALTSSGLLSFATNFGGSPIAGSIGSTLAGSVIGSDATEGYALGAALDFLESNGASKSISNPSILCVNNKESSIYVGKTISISTGSVTSSTSAVPGVTNSFKREDVGLTLKIKPRVSSSEKVTLDVEAILENVLDDGSNNGTGQPVTSKQEVMTQAILRHGESIIIGGLVKTYESEQNSKIFLLGDIPWIGDALFTATGTDEDQDNLVVILTPYVIDKSEKLSQLQKELGILAKGQKKYNKEVFKKIEEEGFDTKIQEPEVKEKELVETIE